MKSLACLLIFLLIAEDRRAPCVPTISIVASGPPIGVARPEAALGACAPQGGEKNWGVICRGKL